jgi:hypothetical protein
MIKPGDLWVDEYLQQNNPLHTGYMQIAISNKNGEILHILLCLNRVNKLMIESSDELHFKLYCKSAI